MVNISENIEMLVACNNNDIEIYDWQKFKKKRKLIVLRKIKMDFNCS